MDSARQTGEPVPTAPIPRARLACAWILACAPLLLGWVADSGVDRFAGISLVALCGIPWLFVMGMPRTIGVRTTFRQELGGAALLLAPLAAAAGLDQAQGAPNSRTLVLVTGVLAVALVLADSARRAAATPLGARVHALAFAVLVAGPPLLLYALEAGGGPFLGRAPAAVAWLARASPLGALFGNVRDVVSPPQASIGVAVVLVLVASSAAWRRREAEDT
ncbi:MAG: hypothetical protein NTY35_12500 [Planctomycetota bacterium]|nr:hypothetical protein [Planctomycetota bacterium]